MAENADQIFSPIKLPAPMTLHFKTETGSTNDDAMALAKAGAPDLTVVWALAQSKGRGRLGRNWQSQAGNLYWTALIRLSSSNKSLETLAFAVALAVSDVVVSALPSSHKVEFKWPNDVLVNNKKISGTLIEGDFKAAWFVVGIGINLEYAPDLPDLTYTATCLRHEGADWTLNRLCAEFSSAFLHRITAWRADGFTDKDREEYVTRLWRLNEEISIATDAQKTHILTGINRSINADCSLLLEEASGSITKIYAGDVLFPK